MLRSFFAKFNSPETRDCVVKVAGTFLIVPVLSLLAGTVWVWNKAVIPSVPRLVNPESPDAPETGRQYRFWLFNDGTHYEKGVVLPGKSYLEFSTDNPLMTVSLTLQADFNDEYQVWSSADGKRYDLIWTAERADPEGDRSRGLRTRNSEKHTLGAPARFFRIVPVGGDGYYSVSCLVINAEMFRIASWQIALVLWAVALLVALLGVLPFTRSWPKRLCKFWSYADTIAACGITYLLFFSLPLQAGAIIALLGLIYLLLKALKAMPLTGALVLIITLAALTWGVPRLFGHIITANLSRFYKLDVDHRMKPFANNETNSDGLRFKGEAGDLSGKDFVIAVMGDSFAYGYKVEYDEAWPYQMEKLLRKECSPDIRVVNMGWVSSSPLLGLRLLKEIGFKYRPDLLLYMLDMTDFNDDLRYELELREKGDYEVDKAEAARRMAVMFLPWVTSVMDLDISSLSELWRPRSRQSVQKSYLKFGERFFATKYPLEKTGSEMERGVIKNLGEIRDFAQETFGAPMALFIAPRAYQYSQREVPSNSEKNEYTVLGPYVREPFEFFKKRSETLPYPVFSLLESFEKSETFPLYQEDDPHWNKAGNTLAAREIAKYLRSGGLVQCLK